MRGGGGGGGGGRAVDGPGHSPLITVDWAATYADTHHRPASALG
jgi:hypothetical protein